MGKKGEFQYAYNGQISVDSDHQIIVVQHLSQNANDKKELKPALEEIKEVTGEHPEKMSIDNGYMSGENLKKIFVSVIHQATKRSRNKWDDILIEQKYFRMLSYLGHIG